MTWSHQCLFFFFFLKKGKKTKHSGTCEEDRLTVSGSLWASPRCLGSCLSLTALLACRRLRGARVGGEGVARRRQWPWGSNRDKSGRGQRTPAWLGEGVMERAQKPVREEARAWLKSPSRGEKLLLWLSFPRRGLHLGKMAASPWFRGSRFPRTDCSREEHVGVPCLSSRNGSQGRGLAGWWWLSLT